MRSANIRNCRFCFVVRSAIETYEHIPLCKNCVRDIPRCIECGRYVLFAYNRIEDGYGNWLCLDCAQLYRRCPICNRFYHKRSAVFDGVEFVCPKCGVAFEAAIEDDVIKSRGYKPQPKYYGNFQSDLLLGVELEVDDGGKDNKKAKKLMKIVNGNEHEKYIYIKHDGSLQNGFEIVSHPAKLEVHLNEIPWEKTFEFLKQNGYNSDNTNTCGLHVHINRLFLGKTYRTIVNTEARILFFFEAFWQQLVKFSRRKEHELTKWCGKYGTTDYNQAMEYNKENRYYALNFQNSTTIEFRIFKGTLDYNTFVATLTLVHNIVLYCKKFGKETIRKKGWFGFLNFIAEQNKPENKVLIDNIIKRGVF
jgi:Zn-finger nucleic acid-binding protein